MTEVEKDTYAAPAKKRRRRKSRKKKADEHVRYDMRVTGWDCYYSFRVSDPKSRYDYGTYSDLVTVTLKGILTEPKDSKYEKATLTLSAREDMSEERWSEPPKSIGSLSAYEDTIAAYVFVPMEHMALLLSLAKSEKLQEVSIGGTRLRYRSGSVRSISLTTELEEDPEEDDES